MNVIFADGIADCIGPFFGVIIFLLISAGSWIMQQIGEANRKQAQRAAQAKPPRPQSAPQQMQEYLTQTAQERSPDVRDVIHAEVVGPRVLRPSVAPHVSTDDLVRHAAELGEELDQADERLEARIHQQFDHAVGALGDSSDDIHEDPTKGKLPKEAVTTREIIDIFRQPERVREAIIMAEILKRPV